MANKLNLNLTDAAIDKFIEENIESIKSDIKLLVDIPSIEALEEAKDGAPFGAQVRRALDTGLEIMQRAGLDTHDVDGYVGYGDLKGESDTQIAAITHVDVVPAGNGWHTDPFNMVEKDGFLLGRGVVDNKGPGILTVYMAKFFAQQNVKLPYTLRIMFGTNEETGMKCVGHYVKTHKSPAFTFTPDGNFPLGYAEKGIYAGDFVCNLDGDILLDLCGGVANNAVPDKAYAVVKASAQSMAAADNIEIQDNGDGTVKITATGKSGHASSPQGTVNAIGLVVNYLLQADVCNPKETAVLKMLSILHSDTDGAATGIACADDIFTPLTCIGGTISLIDTVLSQSVDIRFPTAITADEIEQKFGALAQKYGMRHVKDRSRVPFVTAKSTPMVKVLTETYNEISGTNEEPFSMGGGTYARHFPSAVSFGIEEKKAVYPDFVGEIHGADEGVSIELLKRSLKIFILGMAKLMELDF